MAKIKSRPVLYIIVPCYNEEEALPLTAPVFRAKLAGLSEEISPLSRVVLADDGSTDATWEIISSLHRADPAFSGLRMKENRGHQNVLTAALMWARGKCDITISIDADLQDDIDAMDEMVRKYKAGCGVVCGVRDHRATDSFLKRNTALGYYSLMRFFGSDLIYNHADYRLLDADALDALAHFHGDDLFLRGLVHRLGATVGTVRYDRRAREAGKSKYTLKKMLKLAWKGVECGASRPRSEERSDADRIAEVLHA